MTRATSVAVLLVALLLTPAGTAVAASPVSSAPVAPAPATELPLAAAVPGVDVLKAVDCMTPTTCVAVGFSGSPSWPPLTSTAYVVLITDGSPHDAVAVPGVVQLTSVACPTVHYCLATGIGAAPANDAVTVDIINGSISAVHDLGVYELAQVACVSRTVCVATALARPDRHTLHRMFLTLTNGVVARVAPVTAFLFGIDCVATSCYAVGWSPYFSQVPGHGTGRWAVEQDMVFKLDVTRSRVTVVTRLPRLAIARHIACATATACAVTVQMNFWSHPQLAWLRVPGGRLSAGVPLALVWVDALMCHAPAACVVGGPGLPFPGPNLVVVGHGAPTVRVARLGPIATSGPMEVSGIAATASGFLVVGRSSERDRAIGAVAATG